MADPVNDYQFSCERYDSKESYLFVLVCLLNWIFFSQTSNLQNGFNMLVQNKLVPVLKKCNMIVPYDSCNYDETYNLINIADFNSLIAQSQSNNTPVFLLTQEQVQKSGSVWDNMKKNIEDFNQAFDIILSNKWGAVQLKPVLALTEFLVASCSGKLAEKLRACGRIAAIYAAAADYRLNVVPAFFDEFCPFCKLCLMF